MSEDLPTSAPASGTLFLVSCVAQKRSSPCRARDLYTSPWFVKARVYVESTGCGWYILSAEHGLVHPDAELAPYERTLNAMPVAARREWARRVLEQLGQKLGGVDRIVLLAGERYREFLLPGLVARCGTVDVPLRGLRIGEQLGWFCDRERERA